MSPDHKAPTDPLTGLDIESDELATEVEVRELSMPTELHRQRLDRALVSLASIEDSSHSSSKRTNVDVR